MSFLRAQRSEKKSAGWTAAALVTPLLTLIFVPACGAGERGRGEEAGRRIINVRSAVMALAFSPDGALMAAGGRDRQVRVWSTADWSLVRTLSGHGERIWGLDFSPDGRRLVSGAWDGTARIWDLATGESLHTLVHLTAAPRGAKQKRVPAVNFSPDGRLVATGGNDCLVKLWDVASGRLVRTLSGHRKGVHGVAFAPAPAAVPAGRPPAAVRLASSGWDGTIRIWASSTGRALRSIRSPEGAPRRVRWSPDGTKIASPCWKGPAIIVDAAAGSVLRVLRGHTGVGHAAVWSPDGTRLATGAKDATVRLWDAASGRSLGTRRVSGDAWVVRWSPDGRWLAAGCEGGKVYLWPAGGGRAP